MSLPIPTHILLLYINTTFSTVFIFYFISLFSFLLPFLNLIYLLLHLNFLHYFYAFPHYVSLNYSLYSLPYTIRTFAWKFHVLISPLFCIVLVYHCIHFLSTLFVFVLRRRLMSKIYPCSLVK